jgi:hypothetical protein
MALLGSHDQEQSRLVRPGKEVFKPDLEYQRDPRQRRQRGDQFAVLELRKHGRRESGLLAQVDQRNLPFQSKAAKLFAHMVRGERPFYCLTR